MTKRKKGILMSVAGVFLVPLALFFGGIVTCNFYTTDKFGLGLLVEFIAAVMFATGLHLIMTGMEYINEET